MVLASFFLHFRAIADHLGETARIRGLLRPVVPSNCASIPDGRIWTRFRPLFFFRYFSAESPFRFSKISRLDSPRIVVYISAGKTFQRDFCVKLSSLCDFCFNFLGSGVSYPWRRLAISTRE